jgi:asparagine synthase (glutamine-hydrolysing)
MSGILGFAADRPQKIDIDRLRRALRPLEQRGRDNRSILMVNNSVASSIFLDATSGLSNSFFPKSPARSDTANAMLAYCHLQEENRSSTPGRSSDLADGRVFFACDGVIDNAPGLGRELQGLGHNVQSYSQPEILLAALEQWGPDFLARVRGSFSLAMVDFPRRRLILARDAFGTRPLYYSRPGYQRLFFASQIGALLELTSSTPKVNRVSLYRYLLHNIMDHAPETFFEGVSQIPPGHYLDPPLTSPTSFP